MKELSVSESLEQIRSDLLDAGRLAEYILLDLDGLKLLKCACIYIHMGVAKMLGYLFGDPHNKDYSILGSILGSPYLGKLPCVYIYIYRCMSEASA